MKMVNNLEMGLNHIKKFFRDLEILDNMEIKIIKSFHSTQIIPNIIFFKSNSSKYGNIECPKRIYKLFQDLSSKYLHGQCDSQMVETIFKDCKSIFINLNDDYKFIILDVDNLSNYYLIEMINKFYNSIYIYQ
ncbi:hypothetical protein ACTA71_007593 [Dictyostelium dimigraforme]